MFIKRTDLALEAKEIWQESAKQTTQLSGVKARNSRQEGYPLTRVNILDEIGAQALGKPIGSYLTVDRSTFWQRREGFFERAVRVVGSQLKALRPKRHISGLLQASRTNLPCPREFSRKHFEALN